MKYHDQCITIDVPEGFSFHDRPNYCTWEFARNDSLIVVSVLSGGDIAGGEHTIRSATTIPGVGYQVSGPHELKRKDRAILYVESVVDLPGKFYNKQTQVLLRHLNFSALVVINERSPYELLEYMPCLESAQVSMKDVKAASTSYVRTPKRKTKKRSKKARNFKRAFELPSPLSYLQPSFDELHAVSPDDLEHDADLFLPLLEASLRQRLGGLSVMDAEDRLEADRQVMEHWLQSRNMGIPAAGFILEWLNLIDVVDIMGEEH